MLRNSHLGHLVPLWGYVRAYAAHPVTVSSHPFVASALWSHIRGFPTSSSCSQVRIQLDVSGMQLELRVISKETYAGCWCGFLLLQMLVAWHRSWMSRQVRTYAKRENLRGRGFVLGGSLFFLGEGGMICARLGISAGGGGICIGRGEFFFRVNVGLQCLCLGGKRAS